MVRDHGRSCGRRAAGHDAGARRPRLDVERGRISALLATEDAEVLFVCGTARNQVKFYGQFDHIVLLTAPKSVMAERLVARTNNPYGRRAAELARALALRDSVEPLLRRRASLEVDTSVPLDEVVATIVAAVLG